MTKPERSVEFVVNGETVAKTGADCKFEKLNLRPVPPVVVVHLEARVEETKFDIGGGYHDNGPQHTAY